MRVSFFVILSIIVFTYESKALDFKSCYPDQKEGVLVYDKCGVLKTEECSQLNNELVQFARQTSNQFVVVIVPDLCEAEPFQFATELIETWGIGQKDSDNGLVLLIKPKTSTSPGQIFIATGRGLEGAIPDAKAYLIWKNEMIPFFKKNDYLTGITNGIRVLESLAQSEYNIDQYEQKLKNKKSTSGNWGAAIVILLAIIFFVFRTKNYQKRNNLNFWTALWLMNAASRNHRGSWNSFNSSGDNWGGGFGGFGGGSSGGGGSGGSW
jgi:uncharacterized protein